MRIFSPVTGKLMALAIALVSAAGLNGHADNPPPLLAGFGAFDVTPKVDGALVYMAGFGKNRKATGIHDPLMARAIVLRHGDRKLALVSVDVVGLFPATVNRVRARLPGFSYILVSSTHNHEGPDTLGLWGPTFIKSGIDPAYVKTLEEGVVKAIIDADTTARAVSARIGRLRAPDLLHDGRQPYVKHDELVALKFEDLATKKNAGLVVQWNCHPETLGSKNTQLSADFVGATVDFLAKRHKCPVVYFTGTVGGLMTSLHVPVKDARGKALADGTFEKTMQYGRDVGKLADDALANTRPVALTPIEVRSRAVFFPLDNQAYLFGWRLGVLERPAFLWTGDPNRASPAPAKAPGKTPLCIRSELGWIRLGDVQIAAIPGEIYPELVLNQVQDPPDPAADFPGAPIEPSIYQQLTSPHKMIIGLANDEIGYIIPKRQWDEKAPFCYGRKSSQYGEVNSLGPETAPILCRSFRDLVGGRK